MAPPILPGCLEKSLVGGCGLLGERLFREEAPAVKGVEGERGEVEREPWILGLSFKVLFVLPLDPTVRIPDHPLLHFDGKGAGGDSHSLEPPPTAQNRQSHPRVFLPSREPGKATGLALEAGELVEAASHFTLQPVRFEEEGEALHVFALRSSFQDPGGFGQKEPLEFRILFQGRKKPFSFPPTLQNLPDLGVGGQNPLGDHVGVESVKQLFGALVGVLHQVGEGLEGEPEGVRDRLNREALGDRRWRGVEKALEGEGSASRTVNPEGQALLNQNLPLR